MNNKGQLDYPIIIFAVLVIGLLMFAPIMLKLFVEINDGVGAGLGNVTGGGATAAANFGSVMDTAINFWDKVIIAAFVIAIILLLVSSFFIDAHPFFIFLYVFVSFMLILFTPNIIDAVDNIYDSAEFASEVALLSFMDTLRNNFAIFLVGMMVITGIIIYGKVALMGGQGGRR